METHNKIQKGFNTACVHGPKNNYDNTGAISVPIYQAATFVHDGLGSSTGFDYSRLNNPTREQLEKTVTSLENGLGAIAFSTGMAAIATLMEYFLPGDHIIASDDIYGGSHRLFHILSMKKGIEFDFVETSDIELVKSKIKETTKAVFIETPTNPMMQVTDLEKISAIVKEYELKLIVDNTFMTPYLQQPIKYGADVVIHSATKYLGGHNDTLAGILVVNNEQILDQLRIVAKTIGACLAPFDAWLIIRGIKTLPLRMERQESNALQLAKWLSDQPFVEKVYYPGLENHPGYSVMKKQCKGFGAMISVEVTDFRHVENILSQVKIIQFAESLGGVETLITYPKTQTHADVPEEERLKKGINDRLLRISVGVENISDLISDLNLAWRK